MTATATKTRKKTRSGGIHLAAGELGAALKAVSPAVPTRSPRPILSNVLIKDGTITGTDLDMRITAPLPGADQTMLLPFARLSSIIGSLSPSDDVTLAVDGTACIVEGGNGTWRLPVEDPAEYPADDVTKAKSIAKMPADQFAALMQAVKFATDNESSRFALGAVLVEYERPTDREAHYGLLTFVATDGRRLCAASCQIANDCDSSTTLVPRDVVDTLVRLAKGADEVELETTGREIVARVDGTVVKARLVEGRFPKWRDVEVEHNVAPSLVVAGALAHACEMASICASESSKGTDFVITDKGLWLSAKSSEFGESSATCDLVEVGHACTVKLDPHFVLGWLNCGSIDPAETVSLSALNADSAVVLKAGGGDGSVPPIRTVIMPLAKDA